MQQTLLKQWRTKSYAWRRLLWQRLHNLSGVSRPVFLIGCGRSGTTMLISHLSRSWEIDLYNEDHPQAFIEWRLRDFSTVQGLIKRSSAKVVLFKPILDSHLACQLLNYFPDAKLLFAIRHYPDVINSAIRRFGPDGWQGRVSRWIQDDFAEFSAAPPPPQLRQSVRELWQPALSAESAVALYWLFYSSLYYELGLHGNPRVKLINYQKVVSSSEEQFRALSQFLAITPIAGMGEDIFSTSIAREPQPAIHPAIQAECERLWQRLQKDTNCP